MFSFSKEPWKGLEAKVVSILGKLHYIIVYIYNTGFWFCFMEHFHTQGSLILTLLNHKAAASIRSTVI